MPLNPTDPFSPDKLRLPQSFTELAGVQKLLTSVPVRKPGKQDWFRMHPDEAYRVSVPVIELQGEGEFYFVDPDLAENLTEWVPVKLWLGINRQGVLFVWPLKLPGTDGKVYEAWRSAAEAAERATTHWLRITWNKSLNGYDMLQAPSGIADPVWPALTFPEILKIAFKDFQIDRADHPVLRRLRGEL